MSELLLIGHTWNRDRKGNLNRGTPTRKLLEQNIRKKPFN